MNGEFLVCCCRRHWNVGVITCFCCRKYSPKGNSTDTLPTNLRSSASLGTRAGRVHPTDSPVRHKSLQARGRFPLERENRPRIVPLHLAAIALYGSAHTLLMWGSRTLLHQAHGWGTCDYGEIGFRFLMEFGRQFLKYWFVYGISRSIALST